MRLQPKTCNRKPAFTLIELIVVMAIMGIVMGVSVLQFRRGEARQDLRTAADDIKAAWAEMQARSLAGTPTPPGSHMGSMEEFDFSNRPTTGYGLLLYGTQPMGGYYTSILPDDPPTDPDTPAPFLPGQQVVGQPFVMLGCAVRWPLTRLMRCFVPLPDYSPVLPPNTYIDKATIQLAPSTTSAGGTYDFVPFLANSEGDAVEFHPQFDYERCVPGRWPRFNYYYDAGGNPIPNFGEPADALMARYIFIAARPPQPEFRINGWPGCGVVRFALRSNLDTALPESQRAKLWLQFDMRTGRVSTANEEAGLPDRP